MLPPGLKAATNAIKIAEREHGDGHFLTVPAINALGDYYMEPRFSS